MEHFQPYLVTYGYFAIFVLIFFGIVGIPSPEESLLLFVGVAVSQGSLNLYMCILIAFSGAFTGMAASYVIGYYIGKPFVYKYGKYIGLNRKRWTRARKTFKKYAIFAVALGFFIPGIRQINPYMAGISRYKLLSYLISAFIGGALWSATFVLLGYFLGNKIQQYLTFTPVHLVIAGSFFLVIFFIFAAVHFAKVRKT